jgi:hypothetical protein
MIGWLPKSSGTCFGFFMSMMMIYLLYSSYVSLGRGDGGGRGGFGGGRGGGRGGGE